MAAADRLLDLTRAAIAGGTFVKLTLAAPCGAQPELRQVLLRPVQIRGELHVACVWRYRTRDVTENLAPPAAAELVARSLGHDFRAAHLFTTALTAQFEARPGRPPRLRQGPPRHAAPPSLAHDRSKHRTFEVAASPWLTALGITTAAGRVRSGMEGKLRQIEKFIDILRHRLPASLLARGGRPLRVVDMGAGKGYLTFAIAAWLRQQGVQAEVCGIEARAELVARCNEVARAQGFDTLQFVSGTIAGAPLVEPDVLLALHACDTATDDALARGVAAGAAVLVASPCCHKELRPQLAPAPALAPALRHGILRERQAELVTDALRAALLAAAGYDAEVFEFVATEHSAKNLMLFAIRSRTRQRGEAAQAARELAAHFGIRSQRLASQLGFDLAGAAQPIDS